MTNKTKSRRLIGIFHQGFYYILGPDGKIAGCKDDLSKEEVEPFKMKRSNRTNYGSKDGYEPISKNAVCTPLELVMPKIHIQNDTFVNNQIDIPNQNLGIEEYIMSPHDIGNNQIYQEPSIEFEMIDEFRIPKIELDPSIINEPDYLCSN